MADFEEPAPKRRKTVSQDADDIDAFLPIPFSDFIVLARADIEVQNIDPQLASTVDGTSSDITLRDLAPHDGGYEVGFVMKQGGRTKHIVLKDLSLDQLFILEDALKFESVAKYKAHATLPLACTSARIREVGQGFRLQVCLLWENTAAVREKIDPKLLQVLARHLPPTEPILTEFEPWEPRQFYDNVHVPEKSESLSADLQVPHLESTLYAFQRRAVRWLLSREGMAEQSDGTFQAQLEGPNKPLPQGFHELTTSTGDRCYVNHALGVVSTHLQSVRKRFTWNNGGILADEMGLGKTLELIALICLNPGQPNIKVPGGLRQSSATLIITPPSILQQWKEELQEHAPTLSVLHYTGVGDYKKSGEELIDKLLCQDVVLTTYNVIAKELHYVTEKPERNLRNGTKRAEVPKSPLTQISWWRICLDEAQMVESGVSAAATVARLIPRTNSWAVTGTPLRKGHRDLYGLLLFLNYEPWCRSPRTWDHLVTYHRPWFREMLGTIAIRHSKDFVREDLRLPPQSRHTITIPFTPIEEQHYSQLFQEFCEDVSLDRTGAPLVEDWDPASPAVVEKMRTWLTRLRQTCLHPEVGGRNRRALGRSTNAPLRTVAEVLNVMIEQNHGQLGTIQRAYLMCQIRRGQLKENAMESEEALNIWRQAHKDSALLVQTCTRYFNQARESLKSKKEDNGAEEEVNRRLGMIHGRFRAALELHHIVCFFTGNAYFQLKSVHQPEDEDYTKFEELEARAYEKAKQLRVELLKSATLNVNKLVTTVKTNMSNGLTQIPVMEAPFEYGGIESRKIFEKLHRYCKAMNAQAEYFNELRKTMTDFLSQALIDDEEGAELKGDEYESSTKLQDSMYSYMEALRAVLADRTEAITGQENMLIKQEMKTFYRMAKDGEGPAPDVMIKLLLEREQKRVKVSDFGSLRGILAQVRQLVSSLQWREGNNQNRANQELAIVEQLMEQVQQLITVQTKAITGLELEVNQFRDTMNSRLEYYKALQKISDQVAPYREETAGKPLDERLYQSLLTDEAKFKDKIAAWSAKLRYLIHMKQESNSTETSVCLICLDNFEVGSITSCGHAFCKECLLLWLRERHNCPVCKARLSANSFHDITFKPAELVVQAESPSTSASSTAQSGSDRQHDQSIYSDIGTDTLNQIKNIDIRGPSYGSKIDFLCRHLHWLREHDPGSKSVIFSQYREFIDVLAHALSEVKISCTRIDSKGGIEKFKSDPAVEVFLLHAKAHSAGLNLVVANHVFLCEPLINTAIELQAIARVHRIGQHRPTNVWMYLVGDTVEMSIYDISVTRRMAHIRSNSEGSNKKEKGKGKAKSTSGPASVAQSGTNTPHSENALQENAIDVANSMELQAADLSRLLAAGKSGGEIVDKEDFWSCLFGRVRQREQVDRGILAAADAQPADSAVGRLLREEAAETRALPSK